MLSEALGGSRTLPGILEGSERARAQRARAVRGALNAHAECFPGVAPSSSPCNGQPSACLLYTSPSPRD
eukprot:13831921-Alexandrium_andersonii.AAC.1